jgi:hypothetical protein
VLKALEQKVDSSLSEQASVFVEMLRLVRTGDSNMNALDVIMQKIQASKVNPRMLQKAALQAEAITQTDVEECDRLANILIGK